MNIKAKYYFDGSKPIKGKRILLNIMYTYFKYITSV